MSLTVEKPAVRRVVRKFPGMPTQDGAGVKLTRLVGTPQLPDLDPILMLDTFRSDNPNDYVAGFPEHPHRGFETVSYMIKGSIAHLDNHGGKGIVTDTEVTRAQLPRLRQSLAAVGIGSAAIVLPNGEATKSMVHLTEVVEALLEAKLERGDLVIALGGGVIGDLAGFASGIVLQRK